MMVILIGYRTCGKSTVGKMLAERLKIPFWDTDLLVEEESGQSIKDIVADHGWDFFRRREKEVIQKIGKQCIGVVATGGGVVLDPENVDVLKKVGVVIWLNTPLADIIDRLYEDDRTAALRPRFTTDNLISETTEIMKQRIAFYKRAADYSLNTAGKNALEVTEEIYDYLLKTGSLAKINGQKFKIAVSTGVYICPVIQ